MNIIALYNVLQGQRQDEGKTRTVITWWHSVTEFTQLLCTLPAQKMAAKLYERGNKHQFNLAKFSWHILDSLHSHVCRFVLTVHWSMVTHHKMVWKGMNMAGLKKQFFRAQKMYAGSSWTAPSHTVTARVKISQNVDVLAKVYLVHLKFEHCQTLRAVSTCTGQNELTVFDW